MKRFRSIYLAIASAALAGIVARAERPRYGGTLAIETQAAMRSIDPEPIETDPVEAAARARILPLLFETLFTVEPDSGLRGLLADSWTGDARGAHWQIRLRPDVALHDGSRLEAWQVATALRARENGWRIAADGNAITIDLPADRPDLPWELATVRYAIAVRRTEGLVGTGPFRMERAEPGRIVLRAHEDYWAGRPFVDRVQLETGRAPARQFADLEAGRADFILTRPTDLRRLAPRGFRVAATRPLDLFLMIFEPHRSSPSAAPMRRALANAVDRSSLCAVLLQRQGEPASELLPQWLSGYPPLFLDEFRRGLSRAAVAASPLADRSLVLRVDPADPLGQVIAERIAVDSKEAGFSITVQMPAGLAPRPDLRLVRVTLQTTSPDRALAALIGRLDPRAGASPGSDALAPGATLDAVYRIERAMLEPAIVIPVVRVPELYALSDRVASNGPAVGASGAWNLSDVWLRVERPDR